ncbi:MAG: EAL domain-containing protein, partial [Actinobacteria bacterium]|nr:EAL domain-containing protein [Actinomycetota bacterium]
PSDVVDTDDAERDADAELISRVLSPGVLHSVAQPILRLSDATVIGYELLARTDPDLGPPPRWLAAADRTGRRAELELACLRAAAALGAPPDGCLVFVNVGPEVAASVHFVELARTLPRHVLEITEDAAVDDYDLLRSALARLRAAGSLVAVDDVGSGYASMAHVLNLTPSFVKIDMSLVRGVHLDPGRQALVRAMQAFAAAIGAVTVAEGVETTQDLRMVHALGVDLAQGYVIARPDTPWPVPRPEIRRVLLAEAGRAPARSMGDLAAALAASTTQVEACEAVGAFLAGLPGTMPSVYLERAGVLRCCSRRGQWLVLDGLLPGSGLTGAAFADDAEILVDDVTGDPRYRMAIPGVQAELAVPIRVGGRAVGVCNVETVTRLSAERCELVRDAVRLLEARLADLTVADHDESATLDALAHGVGQLMAARSVDQLGDRLGPAVEQVTGLDSSCLWSAGATGWQVGARHGPTGDALAALADAQVSALAALVTGMTSCTSGGTQTSLTALPWATVPDGVRAALVLPLRGADGTVRDLLMVTSTASAQLPSRTVMAAETCCAIAAGRLGDRRQIARLEQQLGVVPVVPAPRTAAPLPGGGPG